METPFPISRLTQRKRHHFSEGIMQDFGSFVLGTWLEW